MELQVVLDEIKCLDLFVSFHVQDKRVIFVQCNNTSTFLNSISYRKKNILLFTFNVKKYSVVCLYNIVCAIFSKDKQYVSLLLGLQGLETDHCGFVLMVIEEFGSFGGAFERSTGQTRKK